MVALCLAALSEQLPAAPSLQHHTLPAGSTSLTASAVGSHTAQAACVSTSPGCSVPSSAVSILNGGCPEAFSCCMRSSTCSMQMKIRSTAHDRGSTYPAVRHTLLIVTEAAVQATGLPSGCHTRFAARTHLLAGQVAVQGRGAGSRLGARFRWPVALVRHRCHPVAAQVAVSSKSAAPEYAVGRPLLCPAQHLNADRQLPCALASSAWTSQQGAILSSTCCQGTRRRGSLQAPGSQSPPAGWADMGSDTLAAACLPMHQEGAPPPAQQGDLSDVRPATDTPAAKAKGVEDLCASRH